jgi:hypothetical protein
MLKKPLQSSNYFLQQVVEEIRHKACGEFSKLISKMNGLRKTYASCKKSAILWRELEANNYQLANFIKKIVAFLTGWAIIILSKPATPLNDADLGGLFV